MNCKSMILINLLEKYIRNYIKKKKFVTYASTCNDTIIESISPNSLKNASLHKF